MTHNAGQVYIVDGKTQIGYPFQLRPGEWIWMRLPNDMKQADVDRLTAFLNALVIPASTAQDNEMTHDSPTDRP